MNDAVRMSFRQSVSHLRTDGKRLRQIKRLALHSDIECLALDVLHHYEVAVAFFPNLMNGADVCMIELGGSSGFAQ